MQKSLKHAIGSIGLWAVVLAALTVPIGLSSFSPLLQWREPVYQLAGFAGVMGLSLMLVQPLLAAGHLAGIRLHISRRLHRLVGILLVFCVVVHVGALWITSPPDVIDALLFVSAVSFSIWGVIAMWAVFGAGVIATLRRRVPIHVWRLAHTALVSVALVTTIIHTLMIEGTMEPVSKVVLCVLVVLIGGKVIYDMRAWAGVRRRGG